MHGIKTIIAIFLTFLQVVVAIKCWVSDKPNYPVQYPTDIVGTSVCIKYSYVCTVGDCGNLTSGTFVSAYTAGANCAEFAANPTVYSNLVCCNTDYCNGPNATASTTITATRTATATAATPTSTSKQSGALGLTLNAFTIVLLSVLVTL